MSTRRILFSRNIRHKRYFIPSTSTLPAGDDTLISALGGTSNVLAFYDGRSGVTAPGGNVSSWADVRGAGFGPSLSANGSPTYASNAISFAASTDLHSATTALFAITNAGSLLIVGSDSGGGNLAGVAPSAGAACIINPTDNSTDYVLWTDHSTCVSTVVVGTTLIPYACTWDGVQSVTLQILNQAVINGTATVALTSGNCSLTLGGFFSNSGDNGHIKIACAIFVNHQINSTEATAFSTYATTYQGATAQ